MSYRVEWYGATPIEVLPHGELVGEFSVDGEFALGIFGDEGAVIEGSREELRKILTDALDALDKA